MSETLEERLRRSTYNLVELFDIHSSEVVELLDARDKTIAALRDELGEYRIEHLMLNRANSAQDRVLRRMQAELDAERIKHDNLLKFSTDCVVGILDLRADLARMQAELVEARAWFADIQREFENELAAMRAERDAALSQIAFLNKAIERLQAPRQ